MVLVFTVDQAAETLHVKKSWLERQAGQRRIPFTMLGGSYHFTEEHLLKIVRQFETSPGLVVDDPAPLSIVRPRRRSDTGRRSPITPLVPRPRVSTSDRRTAA
jgi:excisionase family DNA binding protein